MTRPLGWTRVANVATALEAEFLVQRLEAGDVPAVARGNDIVGIFGPGFMGPTARGVDVLVPPPLARRARALLDDDGTERRRGA